MSFKLAISRRQVLAGMTAAGLTTVAYPRAAVSQDGRILRVRSYSDIQLLDPSYRRRRRKTTSCATSSSA
jgi:peptide/nickel transport system substrate-binding protein